MAETCILWMWFASIASKQSWQNNNENNMKNISQLFYKFITFYRVANSLILALLWNIMHIATKSYAIEVCMKLNGIHVMQRRSRNAYNFYNTFSSQKWKLCYTVLLRIIANRKLRAESTDESATIRSATSTSVRTAVFNYKK